jgi:hypothetical protein
VGGLPGQVVAVDGKTLRRSADRTHGREAVHLVSAWATASQLVLGQAATAAKSNEITAIPRLLRLLVLEGCVVTIDAMGCQTAIAAQIRAQGADYVLALKSNQPTLLRTVQARPPLPTRTRPAPRRGCRPSRTRLARSTRGMAAWNAGAIGR